MAGADELCIATTTGTAATGAVAVLGIVAGFVATVFAGNCTAGVDVSTGAVATTGAVAALAVFTNGVGAATGAGVPNSSTTNIVDSPSYTPCAVAMPICVKSVLKIFARCSGEFIHAVVTSSESEKFTARFSPRNQNCSQPAETNTTA